jgi:hypothetical protein
MTRTPSTIASERSWVWPWTMTSTRWEEEPLKLFDEVTVGDADPLAVDVDHATGMVDLKPDVAGVLVERATVIAIAEDDVAVESGEFIQDAVAKVAQVHEDRRPALGEKLDRPPNPLALAVAVGEKPHDRVIGRPHASRFGVSKGAFPDAERWGRRRGRIGLMPPYHELSAEDTLMGLCLLRLPSQIHPAPSPVLRRARRGHLHVGGARTALFCWAFAKGRGGKFLLRIEDTDQKRSSDAASVGFLKDLDWLGIDWNEGPTYTRPDGAVVGGGRTARTSRVSGWTSITGTSSNSFARGRPITPSTRRRNSTRSGRSRRRPKLPYRYDRAALKLSAAEVEANLKAGKPAVVRIKVPAGAITIRDQILGEATLPDGEVDDFVIRKVDGFPTYHFAVVVDDELMKVTHVLRAQEHFTNTAKHMVLQDALGFGRPTYGHLPIICNPDGSKMSKRDKDKALRAAVVAKGLTVPPADTVAPERWTTWLGDKNVQLDFDDALRLATALDVVLPEINVDDFKRSGVPPGSHLQFPLAERLVAGREHREVRQRLPEGAV